MASVAYWLAVIAIPAIVALLFIGQLEIAFAHHIYYDYKTKLVSVGDDVYPIIYFCEPTETNYDTIYCLIGATTFDYAEELDPDNDWIITDLETNVLGTDPNDSDSDNDGLPDGIEVTGYARTKMESDGNLIIFMTVPPGHPNSADSDNDGVHDPDDPAPFDGGLVIPESPIGIIALMSSFLAALAGYAYFRHNRNNAAQPFM
jgi:hypothetical protein